WHDLARRNRLPGKIKTPLGPNHQHDQGDANNYIHGHLDRVHSLFARRVQKTIDPPQDFLPEYFSCSRSMNAVKLPPGENLLEFLTVFTRTWLAGFDDGTLALKYLEMLLDVVHDSRLTFCVRLLKVFQIMLEPIVVEGICGSSGR